ncbi:MAG: hypothetical protein NVS2B12_38090 [Ktedonobacteraceae bacterium]
MSQTSRVPRGATIPPPLGYDILHTEGRYFPVILHLQDVKRPGATAFMRADGSVVSFAKRTSAILYLYRKQQEQASPPIRPGEEQTDNDH